MATSAKILNLGVDLYKITVKDGGFIDFFTNGGGVNIDGDLTVTGDFTQRSTNDLVIEDNLITLNNGETSNGVGEVVSGFVIDRGVAPGGDARFLFDESLVWYNSQIIDKDNPFSSTGAFVLKTTNSGGAGETGNLAGLFTNFIGTFDNSDLILLNAISEPGDTNVVRVPAEYETRIWDYLGFENVIPEDPSNIGRPLRAQTFDSQALVNVGGLIDYVQSYFQYNFQNQIASPITTGDTRVIVADFDETGQSSEARIEIDGSQVARWTAIKAEFTGLEIQDNTIRSTAGDSNLELEGDGEGSVQFNTPIFVPKYVDPIPGETEPDAPTDGIKIYSGIEADGGTGLYFVNENSTRDELISRNKALLYSIIF